MLGVIREGFHEVRGHPHYPYLWCPRYKIVDSGCDQKSVWSLTGSTLPFFAQIWSFLWVTRLGSMGHPRNCSMLCSCKWQDHTSSQQHGRHSNSSCSSCVCNCIPCEDDQLVSILFVLFDVQRLPICHHFRNSCSHKCFYRTLSQPWDKHSISVHTYPLHRYISSALADSYHQTSATCCR